MINKIIEFSGLLRKNGIPASIRSTQTAYKAVDLVENDEKVLKEALASVYLKDQRQRRRFDEIFDSVFNKDKKTELGASQETDNSSGSKKGSKKYRFLKTPKVSVSMVDQTHIKIKKPEMDKINYAPPLDDYVDPNPNESELMEKDISLLNSLKPELFDLCQKLGRKIANRRVRRLKQSKTMKPDVRRTIRNNLKYGGTLIDLAKSKPKIKKSNHFFLSDVSGSCDWISNWFFLMVYAAQNSFHKARVFEYDSQTVETTSALQELTYLEAFLKVRDMRQKNLMIHGTSNMYQAFKSFMNQVKLNNKSCVIILSDCRDWAGPKTGGKPLSADLIEHMSRRSRRVVVFNPEPEKKWNVVDSCVSHYEDSGAESFEVRNLHQLADLITEI